MQRRVCTLLVWLSDAIFITNICIAGAETVEAVAFFVVGIYWLTNLAKTGNFILRCLNVWCGVTIDFDQKFNIANSINSISCPFVLLTAYVHSRPSC